MGPAGLFCVRLSQFLMSGSRGHPDDQYRNEKRTRCNTDGPAPLAHDLHLVLEVSYPRGPKWRRQGWGACGARRRGAIERREWKCRGRAAPGLQRPGTQPDYVVFY